MGNCLSRGLLPLAAAAALSACSDGVERAKTALEARLPERRHVEYRSEAAFPRGVLCGEVRTLSAMQGASRFHPFIVRGDTVIYPAGEDDQAVFCTADQGAALYERLGIGPVPEQAGTLERIRDDLHALQAALREYAGDTYEPPSTEQGLAALQHKPEGGTGLLAGKYREGGYIDPLPVDPWGRPYRYERSGLGGIETGYQLYTLGADGAPGGVGENADVHVGQLKYLDLVLD